MQDSWSTYSYWSKTNCSKVRIITSSRNFNRSEKNLENWIIEVHLMWTLNICLLFRKIFFNYIQINSKIDWVSWMNALYLSKYRPTELSCKISGQNQDF